MNINTIILFITFIIITSVNLIAQEQVLKIKKTNATIIIDGMVNEAVWNDIAPLNIIQFSPNGGEQATQKTEIRITYNDKYLYLSGRLYDDEPDKIVANVKKRDHATKNTEWSGFLIDSYNDNENGLGFFVTPTGARFDVAISNDFVGPNTFNVSWNGYWDAASTRTELGWFTEIRVPFTSLPFEVKDGKVFMGIKAWRYFARNNETDLFPPSDLSKGDEWKVSLAQTIVLEDIENRNPIHLTPYVLAGLEKLTTLSETSQQYEANDNFKKELGLDTKIALNSNVTLDLSVNTDFAQVEADNQQINLTRLNLFFPEKRLFFQERAGLFNFNFGSSDKLFHSRKIGIVDGKQTRIYGGARLIGKVGKWEAGALSMQTAPQGILNSENFGVFRLRKNILNENSSIGLILTNRSDFKGNYNSVYGLDATIRVFDENYLSLRWAQSFENEKENKISSLDPTKLFLEISKRSQKGFVYTINYGRTGLDYKPAMGFELRENYSQLNYDFSYNKFPDRRSKLRKFGLYINGSHTRGNTSKELESRNLKLGFKVATNSGWETDLNFNMDREILSTPLSLPGGIELIEGLYNFNSIYAYVETPPANKLRYSINFGTGNFYSGKKTTFAVSPSINITPDLLLEATYAYNLLKFSSLNISENIQLSSFSILYTYSTKLTLNALVQHNNVSKTILGSFRLRYNPKEGNDFYLVYNGNRNQDRNRLVPMLPINSAQIILLKYSYTFHL